MLDRLKNKITNQVQMSDSFLLGILLAFCGGFQDAYTYVIRGNVFANAQTGNVVLMSANFIQCQWWNGLRYLLPIIAFAGGIFVVENIQYHFRNAKIIHWRQGILLLEMIIMFFVGFMPQALNLVANILVSFSCAMQVQTFRKVCKNPYASTMCIGNLRSGTESLSSYLRSRNSTELQKVKCYFGVILFFAIGAGIGNFLSIYLEEYTIWIIGVVLAACFLLMELDRKH